MKSIFFYRLTMALCVRVHECMHVCVCGCVYVRVRVCGCVFSSCNVIQFYLAYATVLVLLKYKYIILLR